MLWISVEVISSTMVDVSNASGIVVGLSDEDAAAADACRVVESVEMIDELVSTGGSVVVVVVTR